MVKIRSGKGASSHAGESTCVMLLSVWAIFCASCGHGQKAQANSDGTSIDSVTVGVAKVSTRPMALNLTMSSELVPFQEIDVYAKESGFVKTLNVDYGTRVKAGQVLAVLEIPELEVQLQQDDAAIKSAGDQVTHAEHVLAQAEAQHKVLQLQYERLDSVFKSKPGMVAQQEVDDAQGRHLASQSQVEASQSNLDSVKSQLDMAKAKRQHDQVLFDYAKITAPFAGIVTERFANLGTLVQAGTNSTGSVIPLVRLSEDDKFRLVIPVPESYVRYIRMGDPVTVKVPALDRTFPGTVARFSVDVKEDTRTMHTEVDVANVNRQLIPGMYAEAMLTLTQKAKALAVPLQAVSHHGAETVVFLVNASNQIESRTVTLGIQSDSYAEVLSGLEAGEMVVVSDRAGLKTGEQVRAQVVEPMRYQAAKEE
jgi:RND family efflux transporter MFP subunit